MNLPTGLRFSFGVLGIALVSYPALELLHLGWLRDSAVLDKVCRVLLCSDPAILENGNEELVRGGVGGVRAAVKSYEEALRRDPASAYRWLDLGEALLADGQREKAKQCIAQAGSLGPRIPYVLLRVASFYYQTEETSLANSFMQRVLAVTDQFDALAFSYFDRMNNDVAQTLREGIPADKRAAQAYFLHLLSLGNSPDAAAGWAWLASHSYADDASADNYVAFLVRNKSYDEALNVWSTEMGNRNGDFPASNALFNGSFEREPVGQVFDWRVQKREGVQLSRDRTTASSGEWSMRVEFEGKENIAFQDLTQMAVVRPGPYIFHASIRTNNITTDQGVRFRIYDTESPARLNVMTEQFSGTNGWRGIDTGFTVGPETRLIEVQFIRTPSRKFDNKITGTSWIDDLKLQPVSK